MRCSAGLLSPARLDLGGKGALDTGPRTRAEGDGVQVEVEVEMRGRAPEGGAVDVTQATDKEEEEVVARVGVMQFESVGGCGGGGGGGSVGGGGRLVETDRVDVAELSKEREWVNPRLAGPRVPE